MRLLQKLQIALELFCLLRNLSVVSIAKDYNHCTHRDSPSRIQRVRLRFCNVEEIGKEILSISMETGFQPFFGAIVETDKKPPLALAFVFHARPVIKLIMPKAVQVEKVWFLLLWSTKPQLARCLVAIRKQKILANGVSRIFKSACVVTDKPMLKGANRKKGRPKIGSCKNKKLAG